MKRASILAVAVALCAASVPADARADDGDVGRRRDVRVVQKRLFPKAGRWELGVYSGFVPNDAFINYVPVGLRLGRHFTERWEAELQVGYMFAIDSGLQSFLEEQDSDLRARARDKQQLRADVATLWSPLYGKLAAGQRRVIHFDGYLLAGAGALRTVVDPDDANKDAAKIVPEAVLGAGLRAYFTRRLSLRVEYRQVLYMRPDTQDSDDGGLSTPSELSVGIAALFGGQ
ncbi:MAG: outer membrane beta-barrel domain-containing protein [Myxococcota bacterium]